VFWVSGYVCDIWCVVVVVRHEFYAVCGVVGGVWVRELRVGCSMRIDLCMFSL